MTPITIDGRTGTVVYLDDEWKVAPKEDATMARVLFEDGGSAFYKVDQRESKAENKGLTGERALGGPGSGHFGHAGRPGEVGGSAPSDDASGNIQNAMNSLVSHHVSQPNVERVIVIDKTSGEQLVDRTGDMHEVDIADVDFTRSEKLFHGHTHPDGTAFSDGDWQTFGWSAIDEMRVVTEAGTFTLQKTDKFRELPLAKRTPKALYERWNEVSLDALRESDSIERATEIINERMAEELGVIFRREKKRQ